MFLILKCLFEILFLDLSLLFGFFDLLFSGFALLRSFFRGLGEYINFNFRFAGRTAFGIFYFNFASIV